MVDHAELAARTAKFAARECFDTAFWDHTRWQRLAAYVALTADQSEHGTDPAIYPGYPPPGLDYLEWELAQLDGASQASVFSSGQDAAAAILLTLNPGDHIVAPRNMRRIHRNLIYDFFDPWGMSTTFIDTTDLDAFKAAIQDNTALIWIETPSGPLLEVTDILAAVVLAQSAGALLVCDNTGATPALTRPLELGADLSLQSSTKALGGPSKFFSKNAQFPGGVVSAGNAERLGNRIVGMHSEIARMPREFECFLLTMGIRTLASRMAQQSATALEVATFLEAHPAVEAVHYPGLPSDPGHHVAARQMDAFGVTMSVQLAGGEKAAAELAAKVALFRRDGAYGGKRSVIEHVGARKARPESTPSNLVRLVIAAESAEALKADLEQALA